MDFNPQLHAMKMYSPYQFALFRIILGIYLVFHFASLLPYATEMWSSAGILPRADLNLTHGVFPNLLNIMDSPLAVQLFVGTLLLLALLFLLGIQRRLVALLLWYGWVCLFDRNNLISNPGIPFVSWILLCCAVIPAGEPLALFSRRNDSWEFPKLLFIGAWAIMAVSYTISGIDKLQAPSWANGSAVYHLLENPLARDWDLRLFFLSLPAGVLKTMTWAILTLEVIFLPLAIFRQTRFAAWLLMIGMHLGILLLVDFADLTVGMLMIHWFTFDARWLKPKHKAGDRHLVFFDGMCGLCDKTVDLLLREDKNDVLLFAPLQGETAAATLKASDTTNLETIVFYSNGNVYRKSDAIIQVLRTMGGFWRLAAVFRFIPRPLRDRVYTYVANNRIRWFGKKDACRMPTPKDRGKLLQ